MARPSRALARRAKRLLGYWRSETRTIRQGLVALVLSTAAGFIAGLTLAHLTGTLTQYPGLYILIPAAVGMRGTIFGAIGARLGTASAAGLLTIDLRPGGVLRRNVIVAILSTFASALWIALLASVTATIFGDDAIPLSELMTISVIGGAIGSGLILLVTIGLSAGSTRFGWDLDSVATPMVTALGDVTTLPALFAATLLLGHGNVTTVITVLAIGFALTCIVLALRTQDRQVKKIVREMAATLALVPILGVMAGQLLQAREPQLFAVPVVMALIPPFVSQAGALGGIFSSRTTSKMQVGVITPRGRPETPALVDASIVAGLSIIVFTMIGAIAWGLGTLTGLPNVPNLGALVGATLLAGIILTPATIVLGYYLAVVAYRFGLDPDNQGVPIITGAMDLAGVAVVLLVMTSSGVLPHG
jgi:mgtE-like transporter